MSRIDDIRFKLTKGMNWGVLTEELLRFSNIGEAYWDVTLDAIEDSLAYKKAIRSYIRDMHDRFEPYGVGLFLHGPYGSGKTSLACYVLMCCLAKGGRAFFIRASDLIRAVESFSTISVRDGVPIIGMAKKVNYLVIDDVEHWDAKFRHIETVLRWRDDEDLSTILTSNLDARRGKGDDKSQTVKAWLKSVAAQRLIGINVFGPERGGYDWRSDPPEISERDDASA